MCSFVLFVFLKCVVLTAEPSGKSLVTLTRLVTESIKVGGFKNNRVMWEKARQMKTFPQKRLDCGASPLWTSKGAGKTGSHLTWPEVIKLHHYQVQKDKESTFRKEPSLNRMSLSVVGGRGKHRKR